MVVTLTDIKAWLEKLDESSRLKDVSYHYETKNEIGFNSSDPFDFFVATPFGRWSNYSGPPALPTIPSPSPYSGAIGKL